MKCDIHLLKVSNFHHCKLMTGMSHIFYFNILLFVLKVIVNEVKGGKAEDKTPPAWFTSYMEKV